METAKSIILQKASNYIKLWQNQLNPIELTCTLQRAKYRSVAREQTLASQGSQSQQPQWTSQETGVATPAAHEARSNCPAAISSGCGVLSSISARTQHASRRHPTWSKTVMTSSQGVARCCTMWENEKCQWRCFALFAPSHQRGPPAACHPRGSCHTLGAMDGLEIRSNRRPQNSSLPMSLISAVLQGLSKVRGIYACMCIWHVFDTLDGYGNCSKEV